jgi:hypothetical protein
MSRSPCSLFPKGQSKSGSSSKHEICVKRMVGRTERLLAGRRLQGCNRLELDLFSRSVVSALRDHQTELFLDPVKLFLVCRG